jgi:protein TonB
MLNNNSIRVVAALVFSIVVHAMLMSLDFRGESMPVAGMPRQKVEVQLVARRVTAVKPVVAPAKPEQETEQVRSVLPLQRPVEVAVREIPAVSLPTAPIVPELRGKTAENSQIEQEPVAEVAESSTPAMIMARPLYRQNPPPEYPARARRRHLQGTVILEVAVSKDGLVAQLRIDESSGHKILDRAALNAVKGWLFEPGRRGGGRVAMVVLVPVRFSFR